jgi:hypothetical protein
MWPICGRPYRDRQSRSDDILFANIQVVEWEPSNALYCHHDVCNGGAKLRPRLGTKFAAGTRSSDYRKLTCSELAQEGHAISKRGFLLSGLEASLGGRDGTATAPEIAIVWPAISPVGDRKRSENFALALK